MFDLNFVKTIDRAFEATDLSEFKMLSSHLALVIKALEKGELRVAEPDSNSPKGWKVNEWIKKAIMLYFRTQKMRPMRLTGALATDFGLEFHDKIPIQTGFAEKGVRVVPPAIIRAGAHAEKGSVFMPSYTNIGAYVGAGTMIDTWATVGSCAQIGRNVHISGGVGIGGVLEPVQASPVIIEDNCFIGSRCIIVEGAIIREGAVLGANVVITGSTKIIDVTDVQGAVEYKGEVPANSVVIPGSYQKEFPAGVYNVPCALIIGKRNEGTEKKVSLNQALRDYDVAV